MCRKRMVLSVALTAFGAGMLTGCWFASDAVRGILGAALAAGGIFLLRGR